MNKIKLTDVIEQIETASESHQSYFNKRTGEIHFISEDIQMYLEDDIEDESIPDWEKEIIPIAKDIQNNPEKYISFPDQFEINEYNIMEDFVLTVASEKGREELSYSIKGSGAFRRFKDKVQEIGLEDVWYLFRDAAYKNIAIKWCQHNKIKFD